MGALDVLDRSGLWWGTALIRCTDHGHYLGEQFGRLGVD
jgi:arylsulfatase A-like enzyme